MQYSVPKIYFWNYALLVASFLFLISRYNIVPKLEHTESFNSVPNGYGLMNIN